MWPAGLSLTHLLQKLLKNKDFFSRTYIIKCIYYFIFTILLLKLFVKYLALNNLYKCRLLF